MLRRGFLGALSALVLVKLPTPIPEEKVRAFVANVDREASVLTEQMLINSFRQITEDRGGPAVAVVAHRRQVEADREAGVWR